jgi:hypothetical protein
MGFMAQSFWHTIDSSRLESQGGRDVRPGRTGSGIFAAGIRQLQRAQIRPGTPGPEQPVLPGGGLSF